MFPSFSPVDMFALRTRFHWVCHHQKVIRAKHPKQVSRRRCVPRKTHYTNECLQDLHTRASKKTSQGRRTRTILKQPPPKSIQKRLPGTSISTFSQDIHGRERPLRGCHQDLYNILANSFHTRTTKRISHDLLTKISES